MSLSPEQFEEEKLYSYICEEFISLAKSHSLHKIAERIKEFAEKEVFKPSELFNLTLIVLNQLKSEIPPFNNNNYEYQLLRDGQFRMGVLNINEPEKSNSSDGYYKIRYLTNNIVFQQSDQDCEYIFLQRNSPSSPWEMTLIRTLSDFKPLIEIKISLWDI